MILGNIYHEWNGTILTITSDSGTSSSDLKGRTGDTGARGAQGSACPPLISSVNGQQGIVKLTADDVGALPNTTVIPSTEGLASTEYVDTAIENIELPSTDGLATTEYVDTAIANINVPSTEGLVSKDYFESQKGALGGVVAMPNDKATVWRVPVIRSDGVLHYHNVSTGTPAKDNLAGYDEGGRLVANTPVVANDVANKGYVDNAISTALGVIENGAY